MSRSSGAKSADEQLADALAAELAVLSPSELGDGYSRHDLLRLGASLIAKSKAEAARRTAAREGAVNARHRRLKSLEEASDLEDEEVEE